MHPGRGPGLTDRRLGESGGTETVTLSLAQMPQHAHVVRATGDAPNTSSPAGALPAMAPVYSDDDNRVSMSSSYMAPAGGNLPHNNLQPYLKINFIIALQGLYPSRS